MSKQPKQFFSTSQISCFRECRQKWDYKYRQGLATKAPQRPLYLGSTIHRLLEARAQGEQWRYVLYNEVQPEYDNMSGTYQSQLGEDFIQVCEHILEQYDEQYSNDSDLYEILGIELPLNYKLKGRKFFIGYADMLIKEKSTGRILIVEHKTFKTTKMSMDQTWINQQTALYAKVIKETMGISVDGVLWDMIKTESPEQPKILKDGSFGRQYSKVTLKSFEWAGIPVERIPESVLNEVKGNVLNFLDRYITPINYDAVEVIWNEYLQSVDEISRVKYTPKTLGKNCDWCEFKELCQLSITGGDVAYTRQLLFTTREERESAQIKEYIHTNPHCNACVEFAQANNIQFDANNYEICRNCAHYQKYKENKR